MKRIAIIQSCYIPWRGFFDLLSRCHEFVIYDQSAFRKGHWHNRNRIKGPAGTRWITIPVVTSGRLGQPIEDVEIRGEWAENHFAQIAQAYAKAPAALDVLPRLRRLYEQAATHRLLTDVNELFLRQISAELKLSVTISRDRAYSPKGARSERVLSTCIAAGATHYLSGPSAKAYLQEELFREAGIEVEWMQYKLYPRYAQLHGAFEWQVSVIDPMLHGCSLETLFGAGGPS